jgi:hypothetical protein
LAGGGVFCLRAKASLKATVFRPKGFDVLGVASRVGATDAFLKLLKGCH